MIAATYKIISGGDYSLINDWIMLPTNEMETDDKNRRTVDLKRWCIAFSIPADSKGIAVHMAQGREAQACKITVEQDENGVNRNRIRYPQFPAGAELTAPSDADSKPFADMDEKKKK